MSKSNAIATTRKINAFKLLLPLNNNYNKELTGAPRCLGCKTDKSPSQGYAMDTQINKLVSGDSW